MRALRVMSFNLRRDVEADGENAWRHRRDHVADVVTRHAPEVLGTQEGLPHMLADLDARLPGYKRVGGDRRGTGEDEHCALYYDARQLEAMAWGDLWLSDTPGVVASTSWGNDLPRMATWARLVDRATGACFTVVNTHFDHRSEEARVRSARFLVARFPDAVILGDFNAEPDGNVHTSFVMGGFQDAGFDSAGGTYHAFSGWGRMRLDWVMVPSSAEVIAHRILRERRFGRCPSDHDPVLVELNLSPQTRRVPVVEAPTSMVAMAEAQRQLKADD